LLCPLYFHQITSFSICLNPRRYIMKNHINPRFRGIMPILIVFLGYLPALKADIDFNGSPRHGMRPLVVHFQDLSSWDATYIRSWSFPGGTPGSATGNTPVVTYNVAGVYDVTLRIMDPTGGKTIEELTKEDYIVVFDLIDYGDAMDTIGLPYHYRTLLENDGASHTINNIYLGSLVDAEVDGQPNMAADLDDLTDSDDEDGVTIGDLLPGSTVPVDVEAHNAGYLNVWVDWGRDGDWAEAGDHAVTDLPLVNGPNSVPLPVPPDATPGQSFARFRYAAETGTNWFGHVFNGEVEDYLVYIMTAGLDYGDAPAPYPTLSAEGGASHPPSQMIYLGDQLPDTDSDGQPSAGANGDDGDGLDDEDGVIISLIPPSGSVDIPVTVHGDGFLHAWIDFNRDGDWEDPDEKIIDALPLSTSTFVYTLTLPASGVVPGHSMARFRYSQDRSLGSGGPGPAGEVEDYLINIDLPQDYDYGDAPESYGTLDTYHPISEETYLGPTPPDAEGGGMPTADADGDDTSGPFDDENGVTLPESFTPGLTSTFSFFTTGQGLLTAFFDWNRDGDFEDPGECVISQWIPTLGPVAHTNVFTVPVDAEPGLSYVRFRFGLPHGVADWGPGAGDPSPTGEGGPGEVEDYPIVIIPVVEIFQDDYGDAPASYEHGDPAYHHLNPDICLGDYIDPEFGPFSAIPGASGDDLDGSPDDEDSATFNYLSPGGYGNLTINTTISEGIGGYLNVWIDLNRDGDWEDADEHVMDNAPKSAGDPMTHYAFPIPETADLGYSFARVRLSTERLSSPFGAGADGEVEDYPIVILMDYGDAPVSYPSAWHTINVSFRLGDLIDGEFAANTSSAADGDDLQTVDDEDGVSIPVLFSGFPTIINVNANIPGPAGTANYINGWIDYNQDGDWNDLGEHVFDNVTITNGSNARAINVPASALFGETYARFRLNLEGGIGFEGDGDLGEVEDYRVFVADANMDFGDAPDGLGGYHYPTLFAHGGAFHEIVEGMYMGSGVDSETDGTPHINAAGDTDEGVTFSGDFVPGEPFELTIALSMEGHLTVWADWNGDGDWTDCAECLYYNGLFPAGTSVRHPLLPDWISTDKIYFRFRYAVEPLLDIHQFTGYVYGGEVEDYLLDLSAGGSGPPPGLKWSQPPLFSRQSYYDSTYWGWDERSVAGDTVLADNWFCGDHRPVKAIRWWGSYADWDSIIPPPIAPDSFRVMIMSDLSTDPVRGLGIPGLILWERTVPRSETGESPDGQDFYPGTTQNPDSVFRYQINLSGSDRFIQEEDSTYFWLSISAVYTQGEPDSLIWGWSTRETYLLPDAIRLADNPLSWGPALSIEPVKAGWDCAFELLSDLGPQPFDFGDAPDDHYPTSLANNGAHHYVWAGTGLGETRDIEPDSPGNETYSWDDTENTDDEDGIAFQDTLFEPNDIAFVTVHARAGGILNVWADYNGDGDFTDPGERAIIDWPCVRGDNNLAFNIASDVRTEEVAMRFRIAPVAGIHSTGIVIGGEVEDTFIRMQNITTVQEKENQENIPETFRLLQNYPNPFNPSTTISFHLPERAEVRIIIYNILGRQVRTLVQGEWSPGIHTITWDGRDAFGQQTASGVYIYRIECSQHGARNGFTQSRKMLLLR
jgi:hypothetical protein